MKESRINALRRLLTKPDKTKDDLRGIYEQLSQTALKNNFFKLILAIGKSEEFLYEICRGFRYKFYAKGEVVFEEGDTKTDYIYFIIRGQVGVFIKTMLKLQSSKSAVSERSEDFGKNNPPLQTRDNYIAPVGEVRGGQAPRLSTMLGAEGHRYSLFPSFEPPGLLFRDSRGPKSGSGLSDEPGKPDDQHARMSATLNTGFFKRIDARAIFAPASAEQARMAKIFENYFLNDTSRIPEDRLASIREKYGNKVCEVSDWQFFGERAKEHSRPRTASIVTLTHTEVIKIRQSDYQNIIKNALQTKRLGLAAFIAECLRLGRKGNEQKLIYSLLPSVEVG